MGWFTTLEVGQLSDAVWSEVFEVPDCSMVALETSQEVNGTFELNGCPLQEVSSRWTAGARRSRRGVTRQGCRVWNVHPSGRGSLRVTLHGPPGVHFVFGIGGPS